MLAPLHRTSCLRSPARRVPPRRALPAALVGCALGVTLAPLGCSGPKAPGPSVQSWDQKESSTAATEAPPPSGETQAQADDRAVADAKKKKLSAADYAKAMPTPARCEQEARRIHGGSADKGWKLLVACVNRGDFIHLNPLLEEPWLSELSTRRGAAELLAYVMATRGGDVTGDLSLLHERRVPVFALSSAITEPEVYKDRLIIMRGRVGERRKEGQRFAATISETSLESMALDRTVGPKHVSERTSSYSSKTKASGSYKTSNYGSGAGKYKRSSSGTGSSRGTSKWVRESYDNVVVETGHDVIANLKGADPFLEPGNEYVLLVQFHGVRSVADEEITDEEEELDTGESAVVSVIAYYRPRPSLSF